MFLVEEELPPARMDVRRQIVCGRLEQAGLGQAARDQVERVVRGQVERVVRDRRGMGAIVTRDLRVVASRAIVASEA
jgi:hypothetical protein